MKKNKFFMLVGGFFIFLLIFSTSFFVGIDNTRAADLIVSPEPATPNTSTDYCIGGVTFNTDAGDFIDFQFPAGFDLTGLTVSDTESASEITFYIGSTDCSTGARITEATATPDNDRDYATISGQTVRLIMEDSYADLTPFSIGFTDKTDANSNAIITPAAGSYFLVIKEGPSDTNVPDFVEGDFLYVGNANQVSIDASVDPSITLSLSSSTCDIGTMSVDNIQTCSYSTTVSTNASAGYTGYVKADGNFRNDTNDIDNVGDGAVSESSEEYGISTTSSAGGLDIVQINDANSDFSNNNTDCTTMDGGTIDATASALTTSDKSYTSATVPVDNETIYLCHAAAISGLTPAGSYSQIVTVTVVGNF